MTIERFHLVPLYPTYHPATDFKFPLDVTRSLMLSSMSEDELKTLRNQVDLWLVENTPNHVFVMKRSYRLYFDMETKNWMSNSGSSFHPTQIVFEKRRFVLMFENQNDRMWFIMVWKDKLKHICV
jgi:hypothetical protein